MIFDEQEFRAQNQTIGVLVVGGASDFALEAGPLLSAVADIAATAIHCTTLHEQTLHHAEQMATVSSTIMMHRSCRKGALRASWKFITAGASPLIRSG